MSPGPRLRFADHFARHMAEAISNLRAARMARASNSQYMAGKYMLKLSGQQRAQAEVLFNAFSKAVHS